MFSDVFPKSKMDKDIPVTCSTNECSVVVFSDGSMCPVKMSQEYV